MAFVFANVKRSLKTLFSFICRSILPRQSSPKHNTTKSAAIVDSESIAGSAAHDSPNLSPFFALVIGINQYRSLQVPPLRGAVPDSVAIQSFLENNLGVPSAHIRILRNMEATRDAIISALKNMAEDPRISYGDAIVIYFAGHGGSAPAPAGWQGPKIEMLVPHDYEPGGDYGVDAIPDRTIAALLDRLAKQKGDNVTVILDCCHSGSGTRVDQVDPARLVRGIDVPVAVSPDIDKNIFDAMADHRTNDFARGFAHAGLRSHVLLAACGASEKAQEERGRGVFTKAILQTIYAVGTNRITYSGLVQRMPTLLGQNPQCEGFNQGRILFDGRASVRGRTQFKVHTEGGNCIMEAGDAHGVTDGAQFAMYKGSEFSLNEQPLGYLVATAVTSFRAVLEVAPGSSSFAFDTAGLAVQIRAGAEEDLHVHVGADEELNGVFQSIMQKAEVLNYGRGIFLVPLEEADIDVSLEEGRVVFNVLDRSVTQVGFSRLPFRLHPHAGDISRVICAAGHYFWHLRRTGKSTVYSNQIGIELTKLVELEEYDDDLLPILQPDTSNLIRDGIVDIHVDEDSIYGIKIANGSDVGLFPSLFSFDHSDLSIVPYYLPPTSGARVDPPLPPGGSLTIGYGLGGAAPFRYFLRDGQNIDVAFLKLFLTTEQIDLSYVAQHSPFVDEQRNYEQPMQEDRSAQWETVRLMVVQRRTPEGVVSV